MCHKQHLTHARHHSKSSSPPPFARGERPLYGVPTHLGPNLPLVKVLLGLCLCVSLHVHVKESLFLLCHFFGVVCVRACVHCVQGVCIPNTQEAVQV